MPSRLALVASLLLVSAAGASASVVPETSTSAPSAETASAATAAPAAPGDALFVISGHGYGHGVGMSQFGAFGMANAGYSYDRILAYYYPGTELGPAPRASVRVLLADGRRAATISSTVQFSVVDSLGTVYRIPAGPLLLGPALKLPAPSGATSAGGPLIVKPGKGAPLALDGRAYRGRLQVSSQGGFLRVVDVVGLEDYVRGVVAGEMPQAWPAAALQAQAVAARSYALANLVKNKPFDLYADQRSQVYLGVAGEKPRTSAAVSATAGKVVLYQGRVASTMYFSSSGGRTASALDVFGISIPYLVSRPDPWDSASPYHDWGPILIGARTLQAKLGLTSRVVDATGVPTPSRRLRSVTLVTAAGSTTVPAALLRTGLGLRSTWVTIGVLRLDRPAATVVYGNRIGLSGIARGLGAASLAASTDGKTWTSVASLRPDGTGGVSALVRPSSITRYRVEVKGASSSALLVHVAPRMRLAPPAEPDPQELTGTVRPRLSGTPVTVERLAGVGWKRVATTVVDPSGAFAASLPVSPGSYRARVPATGGLTAGATPVLEVTG